MTDQIQPTAAEPAAPEPAAPEPNGRRPWQTPAVVAIAAGDAENAAGGNSDDQINFS